MLIGEFLNTMAAKLGAQQNPHLVSLLANNQLTQAEIHDDLANLLNTGLMSLDGAKNNSDVQNHFKPIILKGVDERLDAIAKQFGFESELAAEKSTYKRAEIIASKMQSLIDAEKNKNGQPSEKENQLNQQLQQLQSQLQTAIAAKDGEIAQLKQAHESQLLSMLIDAELGDKPYANDAIPRNVNVMTARNLVDAMLKEKGVVAINDNGTLRLKQAANPTLDYMDEGFKPVSYSSFADKVLADSKMLRVSTAGKQQPTQQPVQKVIDTQPTTPQIPQSLTASIGNSIADLQK